ncbi:MAG TPA: ribosome biogenesis GTPase Der [Candidatus Faecicola pullistercoris]|nr:ribosome biogenesis GTPase Der [Candidatus Faecicola pullistercoris]
MAKPLVAIVGRPNVGKSTLFNVIAERRLSIVEDTPGVTRDRLYADCEWCGFNFSLVDTGGLALKSEDEMWKHIKKQAEVAADTADVIVFVVDGKTGMSAEDYDVADFLRRAAKPVIVAVNKLDNNETDNLYDFYALGMGTPVPVSAGQKKGIGDLLDEITAYLKTFKDEDEDGDVIKIAVAGRPNAGKSSIVNRLLGFDRVIVSNIAGTTRDAIDTPFTYGGRKFVLTDTAGMRRQRSIDAALEKYSVMRSLAAIRRSDITLIVCDATKKLAEQDLRIAGYVHEQGKPSLIVMNKWDAVEKDSYTVNEYNKRLKEELKFMDYFTALYISALTGKRADTLMPAIVKAVENSRRRISTGLLNDVIQEAVLSNEPPSRNGRRLKIYYSTQVSVAPPTFVIKVNDETLMHFSYRRYLENALRKAFDFSSTPVRIYVRNRNEKDDE